MYADRASSAAIKKKSNRASDELPAASKPLVFSAMATARVEMQVRLTARGSLSSWTTSACLG